jgi:hypothetical protein
MFDGRSVTTISQACLLNNTKHLVVSTCFNPSAKYESQLGVLFPTEWKTTNQNTESGDHQPDNQ